MKGISKVMGDSNITLSVFTKPWNKISLPELGEFISNLGFDGIEFPLRPGFQVEPDNAEKGLTELVKEMNNYGIKVTSVASVTTEQVFAGCAEAGIPIIRIMPKVELKDGFFASIEKIRREIEGFYPLCEKYGVQVGIQHHFGNYLINSMEVRYLIEQYDPQYIGAIWDAAHSALAGEEPEIGLEIVASHLCMVNLKNIFYKRVNGPEAESAKWKRYATTGRHGLSSWERIVRYLKKKKYKGVVCLCAEYDEEDQVNRLIAEDMAYVKSSLRMPL